MNTLVFELSMPNRGSCRWGGEDKRWLKFERIGSQKRVDALLENGSWHYSWSDGWTARVNVTKVDAAESRRLRKLTKGFCGYDWMVDSILLYNEIRA